MASQAVLRAMEGLSNVLYRGQRDIGESRLAQARLGLEERKTEYDIGRQERLDKMRGDEFDMTKRRFELQEPGLKAESERIKAEQAAQQEPFTVEGTVLKLGGDEIDAINWGRNIRKGMRDAGAIEDPTTGQWTHGGEIVDMGPDSLGVQMTMIHGDPIRELESKAERRDAQAQAMLEDPKAMLQIYQDKLRFLRQMQSATWMNPKTQKNVENRVTDAQNKIKSLEKQVPTPAQNLQTGLLKYRGKTLEAGEARDIRAEERSIREHELKMKKIEKPATERVTIYGPKRKTKRVTIEKGQDYTPPEGWSLEKPEAKPKAREITYTHKKLGYPVKVVEGSPEQKDYEEDINFRRGGKAAKETGEITIKNKDAARKRISELETKWANIKTKGVTDASLTGLSSDAQALLAAFKGQSLSAEDLERVQKVYEKEINALIETYDLEAYRKPKEEPAKSKPNITHRFVPGKGLVAVE